MREQPARPPVQVQARALGDPTRFAIFQHLASAELPVRVAALTERFGLNHNAIRQHLAKLCDAELVVEETASRSGPGRPALQYRLAPGVAGTWGTQGPYEQLALMLLELGRSGCTPNDVGRAVGRKRGMALAPKPSAVAAVMPTSAMPTSPEVPPVRLLVDEMRRRGFEPDTSSRSTGVDVVLGSCPFSTAAVVDPAVVCEIHRGLAEGFLEGVGGGYRLMKLVIRNPTRGGCRLQLGPTQL